MSHFFRTTPATLGLQAAQEFGATPLFLGQSSAAFFIGLMGAQLLVGISLDRLGFARSITRFLPVAIVGVMLVASAQTAPQYLLGRLLIGIGSSPLFMGAVYYLTQHIPPIKQALYLSFVYAFSQLGTLLAGYPITALADLSSWRVAEFAGGVVLAVMLGIVKVGLQNTSAIPRHTDPPPIGKALLNRHFLKFLPLFICAYPIILTVVATWSSTYLINIHSLDKLAASGAISLLGGLQIGSVLLYGLLARLFHNSAPIISAGVIMTFIALTALAIFPLRSTGAVLMLCLISTACSFNVLLVREIRAALPQAFAGRGMTIANLISGLGIIGFPLITGFLLRDFGFSAVFGFLAIALLLAAIPYPFLAKQKVP